MGSYKKTNSKKILFVLLKTSNVKEIQTLKKLG